MQSRRHVGPGLVKLRECPKQIRDLIVQAALQVAKDQGGQLGKPRHATQSPPRCNSSQGVQEGVQSGTGPADERATVRRQGAVLGPPQLAEHLFSHLTIGLPVRLKLHEPHHVLEDLARNGALLP